MEHTPLSWPIARMSSYGRKRTSCTCLPGSSWLMYGLFALVTNASFQICERQLVGCVRSRTRHYTRAVAGKGLTRMWEP